MSREARWFWLVVLYVALAAMAVHWDGVRTPPILRDCSHHGLERLNRWIAAHPEDAEARFKRGGLYLEMRAYANASHDFSRAIELGYADPSVQNNLAWSLAQEGRYQAAVPYAEAAVQGDRQAYSLDTLAFVHAGLGHRDLAQALYQEALRLDPGNLEIQAHLDALEP